MDDYSIYAIALNNYRRMLYTPYKNIRNSRCFYPQIAEKPIAKIFRAYRRATTTKNPSRV